MHGGRQDSAVGIATRYGLEGLQMELRWGANFSATAQNGPVPTHSPLQWVPGLFPGGKATGEWR